MTEKEADGWMAAIRAVCKNYNVEIGGIEVNHRENKLTIIARMPVTVDFIPFKLIVGEQQDGRHA